MVECSVQAETGGTRRVDGVVQFCENQGVASRLRGRCFMILKTLEGMLSPDGQISLPPDELPKHHVRVLVTILEADEEDTFSELGDYLGQLSDYEDRLA